MKKGKKISAKILNDISCDKLVSVIVPVYNVVDYIDGCIESILCQSYDNFELILVDDGTPDASSRKCDEYAQKDDRIIVVHKPNGGQGNARNAGMDIAGGEFVVFVDSDDYVHEDYLRVMVCLQAITGADMVQTRIHTTESRNENTKALPRFFYSNVLDAKAAINLLSLKVGPYAKLYCKHISSSVRFSDWRISEDDATYYRFAYRARNICFADIFLYQYFQSPHSVMRGSGKDFPLDFIEIYRERIMFFAEREEKCLVDGSYLRFCIVLMLYYMSYIKNGTNKYDLDKVLDLFQENYKYCNLRTAPILYRWMLYFFHVAPKAVTKLVLLLHLR